MEDIERAILISEEAVGLSSPNHPSRVSRLNSLGNCLARRYGRTGDMKDLELAIQKAREAARIALLGDPNLAAYYSSLGNVLAWKFKATGELRYILQEVSNDISSHSLPTRLASDAALLRRYSPSPHLYSGCSVTFLLQLLAQQV
jgi:hypothetical protein